MNFCSWSAEILVSEEIKCYGQSSVTETYSSGKINFGRNLTITLTFQQEFMCNACVEQK